MSEEKRYRLIGKSQQMRTLQLSDGKGGFVQRSIRLGMEIPVLEHEISFHVRRQAKRGVIKIVEMEGPKKAGDAPGDEGSSPKKSGKPAPRSRRRSSSRKSRE